MDSIIEGSTPIDPAARELYKRDMTRLQNEIAEIQQQVAKSTQETHRVEGKIDELRSTQSLQTTSIENRMTEMEGLLSARNTEMNNLLDRRMTEINRVLQTRNVEIDANLSSMEGNVLIVRKYPNLYTLFCSSIVLILIYR